MCSRDRRPDSARTDRAFARGFFSLREFPAVFVVPHERPTREARREDQPVRVPDAHLEPLRDLVGHQPGAALREHQPRERERQAHRPLRVDADLFANFAPAFE